MISKIFREESKCMESSNYCIPELWDFEHLPTSFSRIVTEQFLLNPVHAAVLMTRIESKL